MQLTWNCIDIQTRHAWHIARPGASVTDRTAQRVIVTLEHDGISGRGEAAPSPYFGQSVETIEATLEAARPLLGDDPRPRRVIIDRLLGAFGDQRAAIAAIDAALHDWWGLHEAQPVWRLLGQNAAATLPTSMSIGLDDPALLDEKVAAADAFKVLKLKVGSDHDVETLTRVRAAAPHKQIRVDANGGWTPENVAERVAALAPFALELIEQPLPAKTFDAVRALREQTDTPIFADEDSVTPEDVPRLADVYDGINIKLSKCGGLIAALRMVRAAREYGLKIMLGCMVETSLGIAAAAQIAPLVDYVDLDGHLLLAEDPFSGLVLDGGVVRAADRPGLGIAPRSAGEA